MGKPKKKTSFNLKPETKSEPKYNPQNINDLFDNPMTRSAMAALTPEQKQNYKEIGESMYGHLNFEEGKVLSNMPSPMEEVIAYITEQLKSGIHPSFLEENEIEVLKDFYGEDWYLKWGYSKEDITKIVTLNLK